MNKKQRLDTALAERIINNVCELFNVGRRDVIVQNKTIDISELKTIVIILLHKAGYQNCQICEIMEMHNTSIVYHLKKKKGMELYDPKRYEMLRLAELKQQKSEIIFNKEKK